MYMFHKSMVVVSNSIKQDELILIGVRVKEGREVIIMRSGLN